MRRYGVILALLAVTAAGCSEERAGSLPSASPMPTTATPSPTPTATVESQVEAAARAYYAALETAGTKGDVTALRELIDPACDCAQQVSAIEAEVRQGRRITTRYLIDAVLTHDVTAESGYATVTLTYAESQVLGADGRVVRTLPGKTRAGRDLLFRKEGTTWRLTRLVLLD